MQPNVPGDQSVDNFTLALGSPLPTIDVEVGSNTITFAPFAKTVGGTGGCETSDYKPTNALVGFVVEDVTATSGSFRVSFEDMEQGADNDMDALGRYEYEVSGNDVTFEVTSLQASGCYIQHFGYTVSGSNNDGVYLVVRDADTSESTDPDFALDVPPGAVPGSGWDDGIALPLYSQLIFSPSTSPAAETLKSPLWYAAKWGGFNDINGDGVPQLTEWDSNGDGEPDNYFKVTDPSKMVDTLRNAFNAISEANASASSVGVTSGSLTSDSHIYETSFRSGQWYGELFSRAIDQNGNIANTVDWSANDKLTEKIATGSRTILTYKPSTQTGIPFRWPIDFTNPASDELDLSHVALLSSDPVTDMIDSKGSARLDYIRGVESENFRTREKPLGDIISSNPQIVGPPVYYYPDDWGVGEPETNAPYSTFGNTNVNRQRVVYVGANDGMLHAFDAGQYNDGEWDAGTGNEIFAYVPAAVYKELPELASKRYGHKFYVDATPRIGDAIINNEWQTVLVSGLGRGGQGIFALNVTDVGGITEATADDVVMWEFTDADDADVGYTYSSPLIARMHNGKWAAIFGNGFNATQSDGSASTHGKGAIFIVDLETGTLIRKLLTNAGDPATPNAIKAPTALDLDNDNIIDIIYAGDLAGQVSKYDVRSSSPSQWSRIGDDFFQTSDQNGSPAAITAEIAAGSHPTGEGILVYLTSGKYLEPSDQENTDQLNRIYALWDKQPFSATNVTANFAAGQMLQQSITTEKFVSFDSDHDGNNDSQAEIRESTELAINWEVHYGWYMNLNYPSINGERAITPPLLRENKVLISTQIPQGDSCTPEQDGWLMILDAASGSMPGAAIDLDGNGSYTEDEILSGMRGLNNPLASPTIVSSQFDDTVLTNDVNGEGSSSSSLDAITRNGRISWRELEP
ncbi:MAG: fimbrial assembly protein, partial [Granulosicoccus sp.]|nr:fimbrial assembly protein [Granulosicoccus sp.]